MLSTVQPIQFMHLQTPIPPLHTLLSTPISFWYPVSGCPSYETSTSVDPQIPPRTPCSRCNSAVIGHPHGSILKTTARYCISTQPYIYTGCSPKCSVVTSLSGTQLGALFCLLAAGVDPGCEHRRESTYCRHPSIENLTCGAEFA